MQNSYMCEIVRVCAERGPVLRCLTGRAKFYCSKRTNQEISVCCVVITYTRKGRLLLCYYKERANVKNVNKLYSHNVKSNVSFL